jgi:Asp-tRNA(Asn)/Glu-tRNA(Gln) amidotransferase B subunit
MIQTNEGVKKMKKEVINSPIRWAGSKKKILNEVLTLFDKESEYLTSSKALSDIFEKTGKICKNYKAVCNWLNSDIARILNEKEIEPEQIPFTAEQLCNIQLFERRNY